MSSSEKRLRHLMFLTLVLSATALLFPACTSSPGVTPTRNVGESQSAAVEPTQAKAMPPPDDDSVSHVKPAYGVIAKRVEVERVGNLRVAPRLRDAINQAIDISDSNHDGRLSKPEAYDALQFVVGGFLFRVDENGDGRITAKERSEAKTGLAEQYPMVRTLFDVFEEQQAISALIDLVEGSDAKTVTLASAKQASRDTVDAVYQAVDANADSLITPNEIEQKLVGAVGGIANKTFRYADANDDGALTPEELKAAISKPIDEVFKAADLDSDGKLRETEAEALMSAFGDGLRRISSVAYAEVSKATTVDP